MSTTLRLFFAVLLFPVALVHAEVTVPKILSSHMVLQRELPVHVWGWGEAGEAVSVSFRGETKTSTANPRGEWSVYLSPNGPGGPYSMTVKGATTLTLEDILVGDVWVAGGQSNMEFPLERASTAAADLPKATDANIRLMIVDKASAEYPKTDLTGTAWIASTPESARAFSAVAWYFAREIEQREHVPIGVIDSTWGGTTAEAWTSLTALGSDASLAPVFAVRGRMGDREATAILEDKVRQRQIADAKAQGKPVPQFPWHPTLTIWGPSELYNAMIAPLTALPIRGVIWYQGESNSKLDRFPSYERLFQTLITDWRKQWQVGDFPFLYVQIANFKSSPEEDWAPVREAQRRALALRKTGMAVTIDIGNPDDVHPTDKQTVGHRLALAARSVTYGESLESSGPLFRQATPESGGIRIWFDHADHLQAQNGDLTAFEVAGEDGHYTPATAKIEASTVFLTSPAVPNPTAARYGWSNSPECHLYNGAGLPASPFTSAK